MSCWIPSGKDSSLGHFINPKARRERKHSIPLFGKYFCFVDTNRTLILIIFLISLGNSSSFSHRVSTKVSKFCKSQMELGNFLISLLPPKLRYLKCFKALMELGNTSKHENTKSSNLRYLNLDMHISTKSS